MKSEKVVLYGFGSIGKKVFSKLKDKYEILFWVDGNTKLIGMSFEGISICSIDALKGYKGKIIVTTAEKSFSEIADTLTKNGIHTSNIFQADYLDSGEEIELIPYDVEEYKVEEIELVRCDQKHNAETDYENKVMIFCIFYTPYVIQLVRNMKKIIPDVKLSILCNTERYFEELCEYVEHIYVFHSYKELKNILDSMPVYAVIQLLWIEDLWVRFRKAIRRKCRKLNIEVGGSDLLRSAEFNLKYKGQLVEISDMVGLQTESIKMIFKEKYPEYSNPVELVNYGIEGLTYLDQKIKENNIKYMKKTLGIPNNKLCIMCGYNAGEAHQHMLIIDAIRMLDSEVKKKIFLLFPMTYPEHKEEYINGVESALKGTEVQYLILNKFIGIEQMAEYEICTSVLITMQTTDQLSSTLLENMYCGNVVVAASWLPYESLRKMGMYFLSVDSVQSLSDSLRSIIVNYKWFKDQCMMNTKLVYEYSSWDNTVSKWAKIWDLEIPIDNTAAKR